MSGRPDPLRLGLGAVGVGLAAYGTWLAAAEVAGDRAALVSLLVWLAAGVVLHDLVLAPAVSLLGRAGERLLPGWWRAPLAGGVVVLGSVTLVGLPVLLGRGGDPANDTLLARDYAAGWGLLALGVAAGVLLALVRAAVRRRRAATR